MENSFNEKSDNGNPELHILKNINGTRAAITNYGARVINWIYNNTDIIAGYENLDAHLSSKEFYYGAIIGRYANRIARGKFQLNGEEYNLAINNPPNHLHGGVNGFHNRIWTIDSVSENKIDLSYLSKNNEEGYPGNLPVQVSYTLSDDDELIIHYKAKTDETTIINLTNHCYFNLNGPGSGTITDHLLQINADNITPVDKTLIPLGYLTSVENTPFDFRTIKKIGENIDDDDVQLRYSNGYDHNFALNVEQGKIFFAAKAIGDKTGIVLEIFTDQPGMQLYTTNSTTGENTVKGGHKDEPRTAFCLETQHFPDSPNQPEFPSTVLESGNTFISTTIYKLSKI